MKNLSKTILTSFLVDDDTDVVVVSPEAKTKQIKFQIKQRLIILIATTTCGIRVGADDVTNVSDSMRRLKSAIISKVCFTRKA